MHSLAVSRSHVVARVRHDGLPWLCAVVFVLTSMPRLGVKIGPVPLYAIDILALVTLYHALNTRSLVAYRRPFTGFVILIVFFAILGELGAIYYSGDIIRPLYALGRTLLAISLFYSASRIVRTTRDLAAVTQAAVVGIGITAFLMVASSLPVVKGIVANTVFSIPFLEPASEQAARKYSEFLDYGTRGRSLVGVSILTGAFINVTWPLIALLVRLPIASRRWKRSAMLCSVLAPFGIIMSYSRGAILGLILVVVGLALFGSGRSRRVIIVAVIGAMLVFSYVGWESRAFQFERVVERTEAIFDDPYADEREAERIYAYSQPFTHLLENPQFLFIGEGTSIGKTGYRGEQVGAANHAVFAQAYYTYGMLAAGVYVLMVASAFLYVIRQITLRRPFRILTPFYYQALFASLLGMLPWFAFGHAAVSTPRGAMLFFLVFGLVASLRQVEYLELRELQLGSAHG